MKAQEAEIEMSDTAAQSTSSVSIADGLRYYIVRADNSMIPLVPMDQLPFQIQGIPRQLDFDQLSSRNWKYVARTTEAASILSLRVPRSMSPEKCSPSASKSLAPDHMVRSRSTTPPSPSSVRDSTRDNSTHERSSKFTEGNNIDIAIKDARRCRYPSRKLPPSGVEPDLSKKEYCTHWIRTGDCDFMSQGCLFKHEMPTLDKLREIGFSTGYPRWWKTKTAIRMPSSRQRPAQAGEEGKSIRYKSAAKRSAVHSLFRSIEKESGPPPTLKKHTIQQSSGKSNTTSGRHTKSTPQELTYTPIGNLIDLDE